ncbi:MAG: hypothetical protein WD294_10990 [Phycisphaeraceae bacterium]
MPEYVVRGVDRDSGFDTEMRVYAETEGNARVKAELRGMAVADVEPAGGSRAAALDHLGATVAAPRRRGHRRRRGRRVQTIEKTAKQWKLMQLVGVLMILITITGCMIAMSTSEPGGEPSAALPINMLLFFVGVCLWIAGRLGAWWYHA